MCGRFTNTAKPEQIEDKFGIKIDDPKLFEPGYNIAPTQLVGAVRVIEGFREYARLKWGLIPSWSKDDSFAAKLINARSETLSEKPSFREAYKKRRCLIPATGFYEWQKRDSGGKQPFYFYLKNKQTFGFGGLWEEWLDKASGELVETCTIITTEANEVLEPVHGRMPLIIGEDDYNGWLGEDKEYRGKFLQSGEKSHRISSPQSFKSRSGSSCVANRMSNVFVSEIVLDKPCVKSLICQIVAG